MNKLRIEWVKPFEKEASRPEKLKVVKEKKMRSDR